VQKQRDLTHQNLLELQQLVLKGQMNALEKTEILESVLQPDIPFP